MARAFHETTRLHIDDPDNLRDGCRWDTAHDNRVGVGRMPARFPIRNPNVIARPKLAGHSPSSRSLVLAARGQFERPRRCSFFELFPRRRRREPHGGHFH